mgnify:CR=1 FL=1
MAVQVLCGATVINALSLASRIIKIKKQNKTIPLLMYLISEMSHFFPDFVHYYCQPILLSSADKSHSSVTSLGFSMQGELLLVGHANGFLALWELSAKGGFSKPVNVEHNAAIMHTAFLCTRYQRAITADCKGLVLLHTVSWSTFGRYSVTKTQVLPCDLAHKLHVIMNPMFVYLLIFSLLWFAHVNDAVFSRWAEYRNGFVSLSSPSEW